MTNISCLDHNKLITESGMSLKPMRSRTIFKLLNSNKYNQLYTIQFSFSTKHNITYRYNYYLDDSDNIILYTGHIIVVTYNICVCVRRA